jgi:hypothetical protein
VEGHDASCAKDIFSEPPQAEKKQQRAENELNIALWNLSDGWPEHDDE